MQASRTGQRAREMIHSAALPKPDEVEDNGNDDNRADRDQNEDDHAEGEGEGAEVELDEAALLLLAIGDVESIKDRLHSGIGAPQRDRKAEEEGEAQGSTPL